LEKTAVESLKPTKPKEYRKGRIKIFRCVSGFTVKIRKMSAEVMGEMLNILDLEVPRGMPLEQAEQLIIEKTKGPEYTKKAIKAAEYVVPEVVIEPKIIIEDKMEDDSLFIGEVDPGDLFEIFNESVDFSGLAGAAAKMREKFREKSTGENSSGPSIKSTSTT